MYTPALEEVMRIIRCLILVLITSTPALSDTGFLNRNIIIGSTTYRYEVYVPIDYTPARQWPVIVYLHGNGWQGDDGVFPMAGDLGNTIRIYKSPFPGNSFIPAGTKATVLGAVADAGTGHRGTGSSGEGI